MWLRCHRMPDDELTSAHYRRRCRPKAGTLRAAGGAPR